MNIKENIAKAEQEFPRLFANFEERTYGVLFYNTNIKDHHDSNHAILYTDKINDLQKVLTDIRDFYKSIDITPTIYHPSIENYFIENVHILKTNGYKFMTALDSRIMVVQNSDVKPLSDILDIRQITDIKMIEDGSFFIEKDIYL